MRREQEWRADRSLPRTLSIPHTVQLLNCLRLSGKQAGLLLNLSVKKVVMVVGMHGASSAAAASSFSALAAISAVRGTLAENDSPRSSRGEPSSGDVSNVWFFKRRHAH